MSDKKKVSKQKSSLSYMVPGLGTFTLKAFPERVFSFRKITAADEAWVEQTFGQELGPMFFQKGSKKDLETLCRIWFRCLSDEDKACFLPETRANVLNYETGVHEDVFVPGHKKFMESIVGGSVEIQIITWAFLKTILSARPVTDLPDDLKKSLEQMFQKQAESPTGPERSAP